MARKERFPFRVLPVRCFPALSSLPGTTPAHAARRGAVSNRDISIPISATITSAPRWSTPGMVSKSSTARIKVNGGGAMRGAAPLAARQEGDCWVGSSSVLRVLRAVSIVLLSASICPYVPPSSSGLLLYSRRHPAACWRRQSCPAGALAAGGGSQWRGVGAGGVLGGSGGWAHVKSGFVFLILPG
jgi:hypothetical protein